MNPTDNGPMRPVDRPLVADVNAESAFQQWATANAIYPDDRSSARKAFFGGWAMRRRSPVEAFSRTITALGFYALMAYVIYAFLSH